MDAALNLDITIKHETNSLTFASLEAANAWLAKRHHTLTAKHDPRVSRVLSVDVFWSDCGSKISFSLRPGCTINAAWVADEFRTLDYSHGMQAVQRIGYRTQWGKHYQGLPL